MTDFDLKQVTMYKYLKESLEIALISEKKKTQNIQQKKKRKARLNCKL